MSHPHLRFFGLAISALMMSTPQCFAQAPKEQTKKVSPGKSALPKTLWGDPDLEGAWTSDDAFGVPFERPVELGNRKFLNDKELAERASENDLIQSKIESGERPNAGFWAHAQRAFNRDASGYKPTSLAPATSRGRSLFFNASSRLRRATRACSRARASARIPSRFSIALTIPRC
jgi:hypothetical protein